MYYLELPVMVGYKAKIAGQIYLVPKLGWYFDCGINDYSKFYSLENDAYVKKTPVFYTRDKIHYDPADRFDTGAIIGLDFNIPILF
jgi:hypothetical protein